MISSPSPFSTSKSILLPSPR
ncbi:hypothetical protein A2U01_0119008, partial [Trifolium medium]|nr:hypothetical protein [Trifolium medium]